jgi:hypothetical protein
MKDEQDIRMYINFLNREIDRIRDKEGTIDTIVIFQSAINALKWVLNEDDLGTIKR